MSEEVRYVELSIDDDDIQIPISIRVGLLDPTVVGTVTICDLRTSPSAALADLFERVASEMRKSAE